MKAFRHLTLSLALTLGASLAHGWEPPANPDPDIIVNEALADAAQGRPADAAQKHLWYHDNAVRLKPAHAQIRLTVVMEEWVALARRYPPAMQDLLRVRARAAERAKALDAGLVDAFTEVIRINEQLGDAESTRSLYADLGKRDETVAARFWLFALPAMAELQDHALAYSYLQVDKVLQTMEAQYKAAYRQPAMNSDHRAQLEAQTNRYLDLTLARVVWVLLKSDQASQAQDVARKGRELMGQGKPTPLIDAALRGEALPTGQG